MDGCKTRWSFLVCVSINFSIMLKKIDFCSIVVLFLRFPLLISVFSFFIYILCYFKEWIYVCVRQRRWSESFVVFCATSKKRFQIHIKLFVALTSTFIQAVEWMLLFHFSLVMVSCLDCLNLLESMKWKFTRYEEEKHLWTSTVSRLNTQ